MILFLNVKNDDFVTHESQRHLAPPSRQILEANVSETQDFRNKRAEENRAFEFLGFPYTC